MKIETTTGSSYIWAVRYGRCGEHLKIRIHAPNDLRPRLQESLAAHAEALFADLGFTGSRELDPEPEVAVPPIDIEDNATTNYPDRSLLWTHYRRSHISLGGKPFLDDDRYVGLMTACLGQACERALTAFTSMGEVSHSCRQTVLLNALIDGLTASGFTAELRAAYLEFHRDWLLRFNLVRSRVDAERARVFFEKFERRAEKATAVIDQLREMTAEHWIGPLCGTSRADVSHETWGCSLLELLDYAQSLSTDPDYHLDPFASDPVFPVLFKALHGLANQLGLKMLDEALAYHLLLRAIAGASSGALEVALIPP